MAYEFDNYIGRTSSCESLTGSKGGESSLEVNAHFNWFEPIKTVYALEFRNRMIDILKNSVKLVGYLTSKAPIATLFKTKSPWSYLMMYFRGARYVTNFDR